MIQFNLLPDVKLQYLRIERLKHLVIAVAIVVSAVAVVIFLLLLSYVDIAQKRHINDLGTDITSNTAELKSNTNLSKILTVQHQIATLPALEAQTPVTSRLFGFMSQVTPAAADISSLASDFGLHTITVTGDADSLATVNQYVDTLKYTTYKAGPGPSEPAFSKVVLSSFGYTSADTGAGSKPASYTITFSFDPVIFESANNAALTVPQITTTRSILSQPTDLFTEAPAATTSTTTGGQ